MDSRERNPDPETMKVVFTVPGEPTGKGRPRFIPSTHRAITPPKTVAYENLIKMEYENRYGDFRFPDDAMVRIDIFTYYMIPASAGKMDRELMKTGQLRPTKKPDCDNVVKAVCDALNNIAYHDDSQIVDCMVRKFYSENPRVVVKIYQTGRKTEVKTAEKERRRKLRRAKGVSHGRKKTVTDHF